MSISNELPAKCQECAKSALPTIHGKCNFCRELEFQEAVLCHLNRCVQNSAEFRCYAFQPILKLAGPSVNKAPALYGGPKESLQKKSLLKLFRSDKIKYERALALQKLERDPDGVFAELKYHFAWNVIQRRPVLNPSNVYFDFVHDTFLRCSELVGGFVSLMWLAPDHIHVYVESDAEKSVETIIQKLKPFSIHAIVAEFPDIGESIDAGIGIWDAAYFSETVG